MECMQEDPLANLFTERIKLSLMQMGFDGAKYSADQSCAEALNRRFFSEYETVAGYEYTLSPVKTTYLFLQMGDHLIFIRGFYMWLLRRLE